MMFFSNINERGNVMEFLISLKKMFIKEAAASKHQNNLDVISQHLKLNIGIKNVICINNNIRMALCSQINNRTVIVWLI